MNESCRLLNLPGALKAGSKIASMFGLQGIERTSSINNFAYQITGINAMEMLGFTCQVDEHFNLPLPKRLQPHPLEQ